MIIQTIVIPTEGSAGSDQALHYGGRLAAQLGARVVVVNVNPRGGPVAARTGSGVGAALGGSRESAPALAGAAAVLARLSVTPTLCLRTGEPWREIVAEGDRRPRSLVVMASRGSARTGGSGSTGSVAGHVARNSSCPVLIIPWVDGADVWSSNPGDTILLPLDGSALAELALEPASALAAATGARLLVLGVQDLPVEVRTRALPEWLTARSAEHREYLETVAAQLRQNGAFVGTAVVAGRTADTILQAAESCHASLVVMTTHGRGSIDHWLVGGVASAIIERATVPLLLVNPLGCHGEDRALERARRGSG